MLRILFGEIYYYFYDTWGWGETIISFGNHRHKINGNFPQSNCPVYVSFCRFKGRNNLLHIIFHNSQALDAYPSNVLFSKRRGVKLKIHHVVMSKSVRILGTEGTAHTTTLFGWRLYFVVSFNFPGAKKNPMEM